MDDITLQVAHLPETVSQSLAGYQHKMAHYLFEMACMDGLDDLACRRALPGKLLRYFKKVVRLYDESTLSLLGCLRRSGFIVQCGARCIYCCRHMPVGLRAIELIFIYYGMTEIGIADDVFRHCIESEELWVEALRQSHELPHAGGGREAAPVSALKRYQRMGQPCPFLRDDLCQIYPYRPFACRMHFSLSPPHWCNPAHFQNSHAIRFNLEPGETVYDAMDKLNNRFQLDLSDVMVCGLLELTVNVMRFGRIEWMH